jgi:plastocyanin
MRSNTWIPMMAGLLALLAGGADAAPPGEIHVSISQFTFRPPVVSIAAGDTVTWVNDDAEEHTVTATDRSYTSSALDAAETFSHRFTAPGTYQYFCALHPHMAATVVVK